MAADVDTLQGTWAIVAFESDGQSLPDAMFGGSLITLKKNAFTSRMMGATYNGTFTLDERARPKAITLEFTSGPQKGTRNAGIYKLDGNGWTMCLSTIGSERPKTFATKAGSGLALETFARAELVEKNARTRTAGMSPALATVDSTPAAPLAGSGKPSALEGEWVMQEGVFSGVALDAQSVAFCRRTIRGDETRIIAGPQVMLHARFTIDASASPNQIDYVNLAGSNKGKAQPGIWDFTGGLLRICTAPPGKPRPDAFASKKGDGRSYTTWRRSSQS